jgi:hypothetical protein
MITRRLFTATFLFLCYVTIASGGEPVQTLIDVGPGSGVEVRIVGKNADMIEILRDGREIFFDKILDQSMDHSDVRYIYAAADNDWNICVRCGKSKNVFHCYAVRGNDVVPSGSESFGKTDPYGFTHFPFEWIGNLALKVQYGYGSTYGYILWDPRAGKWFSRQ